MLYPTMHCARLDLPFKEWWNIKRTSSLLKKVTAFRHLHSEVVKTCKTGRKTWSFYCVMCLWRPSLVFKGVISTQWVSEKPPHITMLLEGRSANTAGPLRTLMSGVCEGRKQLSRSMAHCSHSGPVCGRKEALLNCCLSCKIKSHKS